MKKIAVDLRFLQTPTGKRGVGYFNRNIFQNLLRIPHNDLHMNLVTFPKSNLVNKLNIEGNDKVISVPGLFWPKRGLRRLDPFFSIFWNQALQKIQPDLLHLPFIFDVYYLSIPNDIKTIITLYDLIPVLFPKQYFQNPKAEKWYRQRLKEAKKASKIITISQASKKDIEKNLKIPAEKIKVIYGGIDERFKVVKDKPEVLKKYRIRQPFVLTVSTHSFHKNIQVIFQAFREYLKENPKMLLVVVCKLISEEKKDWQNQIKKLGLEKKVILTNYVDDNDLPAIYSAAELFLFPSLYEGFGLPILEAMSCAVPVITSTAASMPEAGGDAAIYIDPNDVLQIKNAMVTLLKNGKLKSELVEKGFKQVKKFSWKKAAKQTLETYYQVLNSH